MSDSNKDNQVTIALTGRIDSVNAKQVESDLLLQLAGKEQCPVVLDASALEFISSAGLRVLLRLNKRCPDLRIVEVSTEIYDIFEMTGITELMKIERTYREISVEGCEVIGHGENSVVYRVDRDTVVKVYRSSEALESIRNEREMSRLALILGIPTAISYDVVRVGDGYGSVFEMLNARSFSNLIAQEPENLDLYVKEYVDMLRLIHGTRVPADKVPDMREKAISWAEFTRDYLPEAAGNKLVELIRAVPCDDHMIHGDYHTKNLELQNDEILLIDMDTLSMGHPIFELGSIYNAYIGFYELSPEDIMAFHGFDADTGRAFYMKALAAYLETTDEARIREVIDKARIVGYTRLIRRAIRRDGLNDERMRAEIEHWRAELLELLERTDTLTF